MATVVVHRPTNNRYIIIGAGFGAWSSESYRPFPMADKEKSGTLSLIAVASADGGISWFESNELAVISVDGKTPQQLLETSGPFR